MVKGLLELSGTIDLDQFWPTRESDGDTVKVLASGPGAFRFQPHPGAPFAVTHAFDQATVHGKTSKPPIDSHGLVTIRLQGIDAPELHYQPQAPTINGAKPTEAQREAFHDANGNFRQKFGETASVALHDLLRQAGPSPIDCVIRTQVEKPGDVFDTFGRMIGNVIVTIGGKEVDANLWMAENGWAFPTFYTSMTADEINEIIALIDQARTAKRGIWQGASSDMAPFDPNLRFRKSGAPDPASDTGPVILPKLFRRRSTFAAATAANMFAGSFKAYLKTEPDRCYRTDEFLDEGLTAALQHELDEFISATDKFTVAPEDLVFNEQPSKVLGPNGKPVTW
jgi:endonuclease YncB( thermonuclease family)